MIAFGYWNSLQSSAICRISNATETSQPWIQIYRNRFQVSIRIH